MPEIVYGPGKTREQVTTIVHALLANNTGPVLATRIEAEDAAAVLAEVPGGRYEADARLLSWRPAPTRAFTVAVVTAGTADGPVAAEAAAVGSAIGLDVTRVSDVGVAGLTVVNIDSGFAAALAAHRIAR